MFFPFVRQPMYVAFIETLHLSGDISFWMHSRTWKMMLNSMVLGRRNFFCHFVIGIFFGIAGLFFAFKKSGDIK
jgi:hypothetical protein